MLTLNLEFATHRIRARLDSLRWERLAARRPDFRGAEKGVDEGASFRGPHAAMGSKDQAAFGRYTCILSGGTWTATRRMAAGFGGDGCCGVCPGLLETPLHRWRECPRWGRIRRFEGRGPGEGGPQGPVRATLPMGVRGLAVAG